MLGIFWLLVFEKWFSSLKVGVYFVYVIRYLSMGSCWCYFSCVRMFFVFRVLDCDFCFKMVVIILGIMIMWVS